MKAKGWEIMMLTFGRLIPGNMMLEQYANALEILAMSINSFGQTQDGVGSIYEFIEVGHTL